MAIDQKDKQLNIVKKLIDQATKIDNALWEAEALIAEYAHAGTLLDLTLAESTLKHVDANDITTLTYGINDMIAWINAAFRRDIFRKVRIDD